MSYCTCIFNRFIKIQIFKEKLHAIAVGAGGLRSYTTFKLCRMHFFTLGILKSFFLISGELSWKNPKSDSNQEQVAHSVVCTVSSQLMDNTATQQPTVSSDNWPQKLIMQLIPKRQSIHTLR